MSLIVGVDLGLRISPRIRSQNRNISIGCVSDLCRTYLCKKVEKTGSLPCSFKYTRTVEENLADQAMISDLRTGTHSKSLYTGLVLNLES